MNHVLAVDHLTDWSPAEWWLHYLGALTVPLFAAALACAGYVALRATIRLELPNLVEATLLAVFTAGAFAVAFLGLDWHIDLLYATFRHTSASRAVVAGLVAAALDASIFVVVALRFGIHRRRRLTVIALACAVPAVSSLVGDGFHRAAISTAKVPASVDLQSLAGPDGPLKRRDPSLLPREVLPRSPPEQRPVVHRRADRSASPLTFSPRRPVMSSPSFRKYGTVAVAAALMGAGSFIAPALAQAQPLGPTDILKIDSSELTVNVKGDTAHFTVVAPKNMACVGPLVVEGSISEKDIDPATWDESFAEDLFSNPVWPTDQSDLRVVVNESSDLLGQEGAFASPHKVSVPNLNDGDYVATSICVTEDSIAPFAGRSEISALQNVQFPIAMHFRNFSVSTTGSVNLGSVDVFGSLGS